MGYDVYVLKFYLKAHRDSDIKYNLLSNEFDAPAVIRTVLDISVDILNENENASFGFIGSHQIGEQREETQRFRIYRQLMKNFFGYDTWNHFETSRSSAYLMLNKCHEDPNTISQDILKMFAEEYDEFL